MRHALALGVVVSIGPTGKRDEAYPMLNAERHASCVDLMLDPGFLRAAE